MIRTFPKPRAMGALLLALVLTACGGGTQVEKFAPARIVVFGDETSVLLDSNNDGNARKFTINALKVDNATLDCAVNPIWIQLLATHFGLSFVECNPSQVSAPTNRIYAVANAHAGDIPAQIDQHLAASTFAGNDLVTILAGANDVIEQYEMVKSGATEAEATAVLQVRGAALADQVNRVAQLGAKVLISLVPDMGVTPYAVIEDSTSAGRAAMLTRLTKAFNQELRLNIINDGRMIGLLLTEETVDAVVRNVANGQGGSYANAKLAACDANLAPQVQVCTTNTLVTGATSTSYLWADDRHLSAGGHTTLGSLAISRAINNPF